MADDTMTPTLDPSVTPEPAPTPPPADTERKFTQADVDRLINQHTAKERAAAEQRTAKEKQQAHEAALKEQAKWQELAQQREQRVAELEPQLQTVQERYTTLAEKLGKQIDAGMKDWPAKARAMVLTAPAGDIAARLEAFDTMRALLGEGTLSPRQPGNGANPRPATGPDGLQRAEEAARANPRYSGV